MSACSSSTRGAMRSVARSPPFVAPTLGVPHLTVCGLLDRLARELPRPRREPSPATPGRALDSGIEAHVHGAIDLRAGVERLVMDPAERACNGGLSVQDAAWSPSGASIDVA